MQKNLKSKGGSAPRKKGDRFEYKVRDELKANGFFVVRQAKSAFPDLIAIKNGFVQFIECKFKKEYLTKKEREAIVDLAKKYSGKALVAFQDKIGRKAIIVYKILHYNESERENDAREDDIKSSQDE